jgi:hypothetical protein
MTTGTDFLTAGATLLLACPPLGLVLIGIGAGLILGGL